jgi:hypothetical protein
MFSDFHQPERVSVRFLPREPGASARRLIVGPSVVRHALRRASERATRTKRDTQKLKLDAPLGLIRV